MMYIEHETIRHYLLECLDVYLLIKSDFAMSNLCQFFVLIYYVNCKISKSLLHSKNLFKLINFLSPKKRKKNRKKFGLLTIFQVLFPYVPFIICHDAFKAFNLCCLTIFFLKFNLCV